MLEIRTNIKGDFTLKETEEAKGVGTIWIFEDLQNYIRKNRVHRDIVHHLARMSMEQMERVSMLELKESEMIRLCADLERLIKVVYYPERERDYDVRLVNDQLEFVEDGKILQKITMKRFEADLNYEPDEKENALQLINFALDGRRLSDDERNKLADKIVELYDTLKEEKILEEEEAKRNKKRKKEKKKEE